MGLHILIVDDCSVMRFMIKRTVNMCGLDITRISEAENGKHALEILGKESIDLMIADLNMPVMVGSEMLVHVRQHPAYRDIPVITVSAESNKVKVDVVSELCSGFIHKPFQPEDLCKEILKVLKKDSITNPETRLTSMDEL